MRLRTRFSQEHSGQALVEFALIVPLLLLILVGVFDLGLGIYAYSVVASAAREGARYGIVMDPIDANLIQAEAKRNTAGLDPSQFQPPPRIECSDDGTSFDSHCDKDRKFLRVTVTYRFQSVTLFFSTFTLTGKSTMKIE